MTIRKPGLFFRALVLGAQGVFYNLFCKSFYYPTHWSSRKCFRVADAIDSLFLPPLYPLHPSAPYTPSAPYAPYAHCLGSLGLLNNVIPMHQSFRI